MQSEHSIIFSHTHSTIHTNMCRYSRGIYLDYLDTMNTHYSIVNVVYSYIKYCCSLCISVKIYNICTSNVAPLL